MITPTVSWEAHADLVVVGGGVAGLTAASTAARHGSKVVTVSKGGPTDTATQYAQGGIAVVGAPGASLYAGRTADGDSIDSHVQDTLDAGAGLCDEVAVRSIVAGGRGAVSALASLGAIFDLGLDGAISRTREGGHSARRIIHSGGDATGAEVQRALNVASSSVLFGTAAVRVLTTDTGVCGLLVLSNKGFGIIHAPAVLLATGGLGQLYSCSTNPPGATADGIALALDAGAMIADLEFVQFHPTVLFSSGSVGRRPLISEALRGEGAVLVDTAGAPIMAGVHPRGDLAPRDVVSRTIAQRMHDLGTDHVLLDARGIDDVATRFPTVTQACRESGFDPRSDLLPIAPAAHYSCGGVVTDVDGRTSVPGLYAAGEVARTGLHGANRLASNSLLEGLVVGERAGIASRERSGLRTREIDPTLPEARMAPRAPLQDSMTRNAGVVRDAAGLADAAADLNRAVPTVVEDVCDIEDAALTAAAHIIVSAAAARTESRGAHTRRDCVDTDSTQHRSIYVHKNADGQLETHLTAALTGAI